MERLLDFTQPVDVNLLEAVVNAVYVGQPAEVINRIKIKTDFQTIYLTSFCVFLHH